MDHEWCRGKLRGLAGYVTARHDKAIGDLVVGRTVLDVGAGYGTLTRSLLDRGFEVTAIDPDRETRERAKVWFGVDVLDTDVYESGFADASFDTVVLREVGEHLDFARAAPEIVRLARRAVILFQTNVTPLVLLARRAIGHHEFRSPPVAFYRDQLERYGARTDVLRYADLFSMALGGGFVTRQWVPELSALYGPIAAADRALTAVAHATRLDRTLCWRFTLRARLPDPR